MPLRRNILVSTKYNGFNDKHATICEDFLTFAECHKGPVEVTWQLLIEEVCENAKLDMSKLRGQGYSGAVYMAG